MRRPLSAITGIRRRFLAMTGAVLLPPRRNPVPPTAAMAGMRSSIPHRMAAFTAATIAALPNASDTTVLVQNVTISAKARMPATRWTLPIMMRDMLVLHPDEII